MSRGASKRRRLRVRRRRRNEGSVAGDVVEEVATAAGEAVVAEFGCCVIEAVGAVSVLAGLLLVPAWLLMS